MAEIHVTWEQLIKRLRARLERVENYNLIYVAFPLKSAHQDAIQLSKELGGIYFDFDQMLIERLEDDDWDGHIALVQHGHFAPGRLIAEALINDAVSELNPSHPVIIGNQNLAVYYDLDLGTLLYPHTRSGHCIYAAPGSVREQTLLLHGLHPQTGSGFTPVWELTKAN